jgi:hypothetical protein
MGNYYKMGILDALLSRGIFLVLMPDTYDVFLRPDTEHTSANAVLLIKLIPNQCEHEVFP